nr:PREDICTED: myb-like protein X isoform X1 [Bemisia tabaci]
MVYESDFYTTRRPYTRPSPTISSYSITTYPKLPYIAIKRITTVPIHVAPHGKVRRSVLRGALDRIQHLPRSHVGASAEDEFLNAKASVNFDDTVHSIRAQTAALLKRVHTPIPHAVRPLPISGSYKYIETPIPERINSDAYINVMLLSPNERVLRDVVPMSHYPGTTQQRNSIGRGRLACVSFAAGRVYPRRRLMIFDENNHRNVRNDVQYLSYYSKTRNEAAKQHPKIKLDDEEKVREDLIIKPVNPPHSHVSFQTPLTSEEKLLIPKTLETKQTFDDGAVFQKEEEIDTWLTHQRKKKSKKNEESNEDQQNEESAALNEELSLNAEKNLTVTESSPQLINEEETTEESNQNITEQEPEQLKENLDEPQEPEQLKEHLDELQEPEQLKENLDELQEPEQLQTYDQQPTEQGPVEEDKEQVDKEAEFLNYHDDPVQEEPVEPKEIAKDEKEIEEITDVPYNSNDDENKGNLEENIDELITGNEKGTEQEQNEEDLQKDVEVDTQREKEAEENAENIRQNRSEETEEQREEVTIAENELVTPADEIAEESLGEAAIQGEEIEARARVPSQVADVHEDVDIKSIEEVTDIGENEGDKRATEVSEVSESKDCSTHERKDNDGLKSESEISDLEEDAGPVAEKLSTKDTLQPVTDVNLEDMSLVDDVFEPAPDTAAVNKVQHDLTTTDEECEEDST